MKLPCLSLFWCCLAAVTGIYALFLLGMLAATALYTTPPHILQALRSREIQHAIQLSLLTSSVSALLSLLIAVPSGYLLSRTNFPGKSSLEALLDIPIVLPPMVLGLSLLIFFQTAFGQFIERFLPLTYTVSGVILAQLLIGTAFAIRTMRGTFDLISERPESVALTLGCSKAQAFWLITLPSARRGMFAAASLAWARSLGEFGPILVFAGATRMKTEVLPTTVWLELSSGNLEAAVSVSVLMVLFAVLVLVSIRRFGERI